MSDPAEELLNRAIALRREIEADEESLRQKEANLLLLLDDLYYQAGPGMDGEYLLRYNEAIALDRGVKL